MTDDTSRDPLGELSAEGVAVWLDDLSRELLASGALQSLITGRHVVGVTTNPTIFASALAKGHRYDDQLHDLAARGAAVDAAVFAITTDDVRAPGTSPRPGKLVMIAALGVRGNGGEGSPENLGAGDGVVPAYGSAMARSDAVQRWHGRIVRRGHAVPWFPKSAKDRSMQRGVLLHRVSG
jgi:hypothetical protein